MTYPISKLFSMAGITLALSITSLYAQAPAKAQATSTPPAAPAGADDKSYIIGLTLGAQVHGAGINATDVSMDAVNRGFKDGLQGKVPTQEQQSQLQAYVGGIAQAAIAKNRQAAKDFLARNGKEKGVITTASGLQYKVIAAGASKAPAVVATDEVNVQYRGKLLDGTEFDSSYAHGAPAKFHVNGVIKGWQEALVLMKPGAKYQLFIPPDLAYGDQARPKIPPGSLLTFEVELLDVVAPTPAQTPAAPAVKK
jgi:FKBP-type peptidyl-prolyl cis-trans isomerase FklB